MKRLLLGILSASLVLSACNNASTKIDSKTVGSEKLVNPAEGKYIKGVTAANLDYKKQLFEQAGIYQGLSDSRFLEINSNGLTSVFRYDEMSDGLTENLELEQKITFTYYINESKEKVLQSIK